MEKNDIETDELKRQDEVYEKLCVLMLEISKLKQGKPITIGRSIQLYLERESVELLQLLRGNQDM
jgi:hypothetical protein